MRLEKGVACGNFELFFLNFNFSALKNPNETPAPTRAETREERITRKVNGSQSPRHVHILIKAHLNINDFY